MAPHSSTLAWKMPWMEEPGRLQSMGLLRVGNDWATSLSLFTFMHWRRKWQPIPVFLPGESQGGLLSMGSHSVGHDWSDLAAVAAAYIRSHSVYSVFSGFLSSKTTLRCIHVVARMCACSVAQLYSILCNPMDSSPPDFSVHGILAGKNAGADGHFLLQDIFPIQRSTHVFCISRQIPYRWATWEAPCISCLFLHMALPWFVFPFTSWWTCVFLFFVFCLVSQILAIRDQTAMSYMYTSLCGCLFSILIPTCEISGLHDSPDMFNFLRNY